MIGIDNKFGDLTSSVRYSSNPTTNRVIEGFNYNFGTRSGLNIFRPEEQILADANAEGKGEKLFTTG